MEVRVSLELQRFATSAVPMQYIDTQIKVK